MSKLQLLVTNSKLKDSSVYTYAFNLPAVSTCPGAGICREYCFAAAEQRQYKGAREMRERNLALSKTNEFHSAMQSDLELLRKLHDKRGTEFAVRIHASGDFYSLAYIDQWIDIVRTNRDITFYAYTKSIAHWRRWKAREFAEFGGQSIPHNLRLIYSLGGTQDAQIDLGMDRHAKIFTSEIEAMAAGYALASEDDTVAWQSVNHRIGLVIFGATRKFEKAVANSKGN